MGAEARTNRDAIGDFKLLSQVRLTHFTPEHRVPSIALVLTRLIPTGNRIGSVRHKNGHGSGSFATGVGVNVQHYFLLENGRLLRARINFLQRFSHGGDVDGPQRLRDRPGFHGHARPGNITTLIGAVEYSLTREWVLAFDVDPRVHDQGQVSRPLRRRRAAGRPGLPAS